MHVATASIETGELPMFIAVTFQACMLTSEYEDRTVSNPPFVLFGNLQSPVNGKELLSSHLAVRVSF